MIPKSFKIANQTITVNVVDKIDGGSYGNFSDVINEINIAKNIEFNGKVYQLTEEQIENSFYHELMHSFQFYFCNKYDETQAQVFANFMREFLSTSTNE